MSAITLASTGTTVTPIRALESRVTGLPLVGRFRAPARKEDVLRCSLHSLSESTHFEYGFERRIHVSFTLPETAAGKRLAITMTISTDTLTARKTVAFTVAP